MSRGKSIRSAIYVVEMDDGTRWGVPVEVIALHRAASYAEDYGGNTARSLEEDTWPTFEGDEFQVEDWAINNMDWKDVEAHAKLVHDDVYVDYQDGWVGGEHEIRDREACPGFGEEKV